MNSGKCEEQIASAAEPFSLMYADAVKICKSWKKPFGERSVGENLASSDVGILTPDGEVIRPVVGVGEGLYQLPWP